MHRSLRLLLGSIVAPLLALLPGLVHGQDDEPVPAPPEPAPILQPAPASARIDAKVIAVGKVLPSVVNISTERIVDSPPRSRQQYDPYTDLFERFFNENRQGGGERSANSLGSGVIIDPHGLILTNDHVVQRATRIIVTTADGRNFDATPVATDTTNDLALLRVTNLPADQTLTAVAFGIPDDLYLGETVISIGNPFGLGHSVSSGLLSAKGRRAQYRNQLIFDDILQTDAAINPGNSGGPLVNLDGELIGINLAIRADAEGIGFVIPLARLETVLAGWMVPQRFAACQLGLVPATARDAGGAPHAVVGSVYPDSPAAEAGLEVGAVITHVDGSPVRQAIDVSRRIWRHAAGDTVTLTLASGVDIAISVEAVAPMSGEELAKAKLHLGLQELTPTLAKALRLPYSRGLVVSDVEEGSLLNRRGIQRGDVLTQVGELPVSSLDDLARALNASHPGDVVELIIHRAQRRGNALLIQRFVVLVPM